MSYHTKRKQKQLQKKCNQKKILIFTIIIFKPILYIIAEAVESNIGNIENLNKTYIDVVKIISSYNYMQMESLNKNNDIVTITVDEIKDFYNNTIEKKVAIIEAINQDVSEFLNNVYNAKAGLYHYNELYEGNIKGFAIKHLTEKCKDDVEISNFHVVRDDTADEIGTKIRGFGWTVGLIWKF